MLSESMWRKPTLIPPELNKRTIGFKDRFDKDSIEVIDFIFAILQGLALIASLVGLLIAGYIFFLKAFFCIFVLKFGQFLISKKVTYE